MQRGAGNVVNAAAGTGDGFKSGGKEIRYEKNN